MQSEMYLTVDAMVILKLNIRRHRHASRISLTVTALICLSWKI